jgi:hypothetical protein
MIVGQCIALDPLLAKYWCGHYITRNQMAITIDGRLANSEDPLM